MRFWLTAFVTLLLVQSSARGIVIETEKKVRVAGYLRSEDTKILVIVTKLPDGSEKRNVFDRTKVTIIHRIDLARLQKLDAKNPKAYFDYAKDLAKQQKVDPEAGDVAIRLYLIAAHLDGPNLGVKSLVGMADLATQAADARKYQAMAYLLDPAGDPKLLKIAAKKGQAVAPEVKAAPKPLTRFQKALERYRAGDVVKAKTDANEKGVPEYFSKAGLDQRDFLQACDDLTCTKCKRAGVVTCTTCKGKGKVLDMMDPFGGMRVCSTCNGKGKQKCATCDGSGLNAFPEDYLKAVVRAEIWALDQIVTVEPVAKKTSGSWGDALNDNRTKGPLLTLETITPFDPRECVFREGKWVAPQ